MPINKNAYIRYRALDECLCSKRHRYTFADLKRHVEERIGYSISERQIREDMVNMTLEPFNASIAKTPVYNSKKYYYHYSDPDFSIVSNELSDEEISNLHSTIDLLSKFRGIPAYTWIEEVISNLEYRFGVKPESRGCISFEQNAELKGLEHLSQVIDATINQQPLDIEYQSFTMIQRKCSIHPYHVKQYNSRWFLFAYDESSGKISNFALDRIVSIKTIDIPFTKSNVDFNTYFRDIIGVSVPDNTVPIEKIILRFSERRFPYVMSKPLHTSQKEEDEPYTISIMVKPTRELTQQIFSYIPDIEVLSPEWFREEIKEKIADNLKKYSALQKECKAMA